MDDWFWGSMTFPKHELNLNYIQKFSSYLKEKTLLHWTDQKLATFKELIADCYKNHTEQKYTLWVSGENFIL